MFFVSYIFQNKAKIEPVKAFTRALCAGFILKFIRVVIGL